MRVIFYRRGFTEYAIQPDVSLSVVRYSHHAVGGSKIATLQASGKLDALFELVNHLREPIEIINDKGDCVWWGYLASLLIHTGVGSYGVDIDKMSNRVRVIYNDGRVRYLTDWAGDAESITEYGTKELLVAKSDVIRVDALQTRDVQLSNTRYPVPVLKFSSGKEGTATITCRGWLETLQWQYYENLSGKESYTDLGRGGREIGEDDRPIMAQSFHIASTAAWNATSIWLRIWYQGTAVPTDDVVVSLKADNAGVPGATIESGSVAAANISEQAEWCEFVLSGAVTLNPATKYWIHVQRDDHPAIDPDAYYMIDTNFDAGYSRGELFLYNETLSAWSEDIYMFWGDMLFMVVGDLATTAQIVTLVTSTGQFFVGTIIEDASGVDTNPYRDGITAGGYELDKLLKAGTTNDRRLLCEVTQGRYLRVYEEPARPANVMDSYALNRDGQLLTSALTPIDMSLCPVGIWCHLHNIIPASVDLSLIADPSLFFIEEAIYDVQNERYILLSTRDQADTLDIGGVVPG